MPAPQLNVCRIRRLLAAGGQNGADDECEGFLAEFETNPNIVLDASNKVGVVLFLYLIFSSPSPSV